MDEDTEASVTVTAFDLVSGAALGALLGLLMGFSTSPVTSIVITGLVGLLGAFLGFSDASALRLAATGLRRLTAFACAAIVVIPIAIWARTHDLLSPSLDDERAALSNAGFKDSSVEMRDMLAYMRWGVVPQGAAVASTPSQSTTVLYGTSAGDFCDDISRVSSPQDLIAILKSAKSSIKDAASSIERMTPADQASAVPLVKALVCGGAS